MRLKSLELHGYKTFATRTLFEFDAAVTAIVGPNGSGKSNIADALRWVLGEQSYSILRGKKTEDMIFSGSEQRSRAGMASATLVFNNEDGWLPIEYTEVAITRRAYRDSQNEYLLNRQRVRLKDVSELLANSGLAERTYTIIGQGLVDAALALKAEERRMLFEEAAGIGLYRSRREEALRRLEVTRRNLDRVSDILAELEPRLRSLERQAKRAQEHERIKAELKSLLKVWYGYQWQRAQKDIAVSRQTVMSYEGKLIAARQELIDLNHTIENVRRHIQQQRSQLNDLRQQLDEEQGKREAIRRERAILEERLRSMEEQSVQFSREVSRYLIELNDLRIRHEQDILEIEDIEKNIGVARGQLAKLREELNVLLAEREKKDRDISVIQGRISELSSIKTHLSSKLTKEQAEIEQLDNNLAEIRDQIDSAVSELDIAGNRMKQSQAALQNAKDQRLFIENELRVIQERKRVLDLSREKTIAEEAKRQGEIAGLTAQLEAMIQSETDLTVYSTGAKVLLQAASQGKFNGVLGVLSSYLEIPVELETVIAAVLGEFLDAVILENGSNIEELLLLLEEKKTRSALLPLDNLPPSDPFTRSVEREIISKLGDENIIGRAAELVTASSEISGVIELLLGDFWVVRDRETAREILNLVDRTDKTRGYAGVVTLGGEVFFLRGPVLAGQDVRKGSIGLKRRQREIDSLLRQTKNSYNKIVESRQAIEEDRQRILVDIEECERKYHAAFKNEEEATIAYSHNLDVGKQTRKRLNLLKARCDHFEQEILQKREKVSRLKLELGQCEEELSRQESDFEERLRIFDQVSLNELKQKVNECEKHVLVGEQALEGAKRRLEERQENIDKIQAIHREFEERLDSVKKQILTLQTHIEKLKRGEVKFTGRIDDQQALLSPAEENLKLSDDKLVELEKSESEARQILNLVENQHAQARLELARRQESLEALQRRIEDDFGLVAYEYTEDVSGPTPLPIEGLIEELPVVDSLSPEVEENIKRQRILLRRLGAINPEAQEEYREVKDRFDFLTEQMADLNKAETDIRRVIADLDELMENEFYRTFEAVAEEFKLIFFRLFGGGSARLVLTDPDDLTNSGIEIEARLPGRREQGLSLLSGGERSLTAVALVFALLRVSPTPFCVLDEVDAMLDEVNVGRFRDLLRELSETTQFVIITHNRNTVQVADIIYGVTMGKDSTSRVISLKPDQVERAIVA